jgi:hypothetical protein
MRTPIAQPPGSTRRVKSPRKVLPTKAHIEGIGYPTSLQKGLLMPIESEVNLGKVEVHPARAVLEGDIKTSMGYGTEALVLVPRFHVQFDPTHVTIVDAGIGPHGTTIQWVVVDLLREAAMILGPRTQASPTRACIVLGKTGDASDVSCVKATLRFHTQIKDCHRRIGDQ